MEITLPEPIQGLLGGLESKAVTNIYGAPGTGKTNICLLAAAEAHRRGLEVVYMDTEGGLSPKRLEQIYSDHDALMESIVLLEPRSFSEQARMIRLLHSHDPGIIILDSASALYRLEYADSEDSADKCMEANRELSKQLSILSNISRDRDIPVLITAHMYTHWDTGENRIIGGDFIKYWSKVILFLERTGRTSERRATVVKHRSLPEGNSARFMLVQEGIKTSGFKLF